MSKKKKKRRSGKARSNPYNRSEGSILADEQYQYRNEKKMNPTARNLLLTDLVVLAIALLGDRFGFISPMVSTVITIVGLVLLLVALWYQFGGGGRKDKGLKR